MIMKPLSDEESALNVIRTEKVDQVKKYVRRRLYAFLSYSETKLDAIAYQLSPDG